MELACAIFSSQAETDHWEMDAHEHECYEVSVLENGQGTFRVEDRSWTIEKGSVVMIAPGLRHHYQGSAGMRFCVLQFADSGTKTEPLFLSLARDENVTVLRLSPYDLAEYETLFCLFLRLAVSTAEDSDSHVRAWIDLLLRHLGRATKNNQTVSLSQTAEYISLHLSTTLSVSELAQTTGMSVSTFRAAFRKAYGSSPKQYQRIKRIEETKRLLRSSDLTMAQITDRLGLQDQHYFSNWFAQAEGISPSRWRIIERSR